MNYLFFALGLAVGAFQLYLTGKTVDCLTEKNNNIFIFVFIKLALYAGLISVMYIFLRNYLLYAGIGFGAGMIAGAFINFVIKTNKDKSNDKGDGTP